MNLDHRLPDAFAIFGVRPTPEDIDLAATAGAIDSARRLAGLLGLDYDNALDRVRIDQEQPPEDRPPYTFSDLVSEIDAAADLFVDRITDVFPDVGGAGDLEDAGSRR
ncbi:hypothetical protein [Streptomyces sp. NPDC101115]|uniref:hypothetical protein n=1 Tax=Streptomyces sp. NPDC101115 TaxID=3366106 RepID=UPI0037F8DB3A